MLRRQERIRRARRVRHATVTNVIVWPRGSGDPPVFESRPGEVNVIVRFRDMRSDAWQEPPKVPARERPTATGVVARTVAAREAVRVAAAHEKRLEERANETPGGSLT